MVGVWSLLFTKVCWRWVGAGVALVFGLGRIPLLVPVALAGSGFAYTLRRLRAKREATATDAADLATLCDLTALSLTAGLGLHAALDLASAETGGRVGAEVGNALRSARVQGTAAAMAVADGIGRPLYRTLARTATTGAAALPPVVQLADDLNAELAARRLEAVRRKPIAMLFPLTLLILPGFLLLAIAPAVLDALGRLDM
jgi:hypothetical protein